jgi:uncharacterized membrane protein SpoIIM required for sporulation
LSNFWKNTSAKHNRLLTILIFFLLSIVITIAGVLTPLSPEDLKSYNDQYNQLENDLKGNNVWQDTIYIFTNNIKICLLMFVPIAGLLLGSYILYNTGQIIEAESHTLNVSGLVVFGALFISPHTWLEFMAYSIALASSMWLIWKATKHQLRKEIIQTLKLIGFSALILLAAAFIEAYLIVSFSSA